MKRLRVRRFHRLNLSIKLKKSKIWLFKQLYRHLSRKLGNSQMSFSQNSTKSKRRSKEKRKTEKFNKRWRVASLFHHSNRLMLTSSLSIPHQTKDLWILLLTRTNSACSLISNSLSSSSSFNVVLPQFTQVKPFLILIIRSQSSIFSCKMTFSRNALTLQIFFPSKN
jgi:hypothetical protein